MRRSRRGGGSHSEFASSGEDSFVAVVVTKLTGALLFILLLTMVIMALLPKAVDVAQLEKSSTSEAESSEKPAPLQIRHSGDASRCHRGSALPGRAGGHGRTRTAALVGAREMPEWLSLDESNGRIGGTPPRQTDKPLPLLFQVSDGNTVASQPHQLVVLPSQAPVTIGETLRRLRWPSMPSRAWLEQGVGFLVLWLVHLLGMNLLANLERGSLEETVMNPSGLDAQLTVNKRFATYRLLIRLATLSAMIGLAAWLLMARASTVS